jgi:cytochrome P450
MDVESSTTRVNGVFIARYKTWAHRMLQFSLAIIHDYRNNMSFYIALLVVCTSIGWYLHFIFHNANSRAFNKQLGKIPGPWLFRVTKWRLAYEDWKGTRCVKINELHNRYGPLVRIGPNEISFNSISALKTIYGAGSGFERTDFYDMFDVYGEKNLFTFHSSRDHADRKKLLAQAYTKSAMLNGENPILIQNIAFEYLKYLKKIDNGIDEIFTSLHYFAIDAITEFLYGNWGRTKCLAGDKLDRLLLQDIMDVSRRRLSWFMVHVTTFTKWLYTKTSVSSLVARLWLPMTPPTTYSGIRVHALEAFKNFYAPASADNISASGNSIVEKLWRHHSSQKKGGLNDLEFASEAADHLLAGIDTTSDSLLFLIWALSRPRNAHIQEKLITEVDQLQGTDLDINGIPTVAACDRLRYLDAVIKETLRLYAPLPASEPRLSRLDTVIDGYQIPALTVVGMSPFTLHRNPEVFEEPLDFTPSRWLSPDSNQVEMKRWFWAFSSGARMCIGMQ